MQVSNIFLNPLSFHYVGSDTRNFGAIAENLIHNRQDLRYVIFASQCEYFLNRYFSNLLCCCLQKGDVAKTTLIDADKVKELAPILDTKTVLGALYTSGDGYINVQNLTLALAKGAEKRGAVLVEQCPKIKAVEEGKTDWIVKFCDGSQIRTRNIINAAGGRIC